MPFRLRAQHRSFVAPLKRWPHLQHNESIHDAPQCGQKRGNFLSSAHFGMRDVAGGWQTNAGIETTLFIGWNEFARGLFCKSNIPFGNLHASSRFPTTLLTPLLPSVPPANARDSRSYIICNERRGHIPIHGSNKCTTISLLIFEYFRVSFMARVPSSGDSTRWWQKIDYHILISLQITIISW